MGATEILISVHQYCHCARQKNAHHKENKSPPHRVKVTDKEKWRIKKNFSRGRVARPPLAPSLQAPMHKYTKVTIITKTKCGRNHSYKVLQQQSIFFSN